MLIPPAEFVWFPATETHINDPHFLDDFLAQLSKVDGMVGAYGGFEFEDSGNAYWVNVWSSLDAHENFKKDPSYPGLVKMTGPIFKEKPELAHIKFNSNYIKMMDAPATEFAWITLKDGHTMEELEPLMGNLVAGLAQAKGSHSSAWGATVEKPNMLVLFVGWDSVEAHWEAVKHDPLVKTIGEIKAIADISLKHAKLTKWSK